MVGCGHLVDGCHDNSCVLDSGYLVDWSHDNICVLECGHNVGLFYLHAVKLLLMPNFVQ